MASIKNIEGLTAADLQRELANGAKFVLYEYCISILIMTFKRGSSVYYIREGESRVSHGLKYSAISLFVGWWGIPWGPIYTIGSFITNFRGGKDVTQEVLNSMKAHSAANPQGV